MTSRKKQIAAIQTKAGELYDEVDALISELEDAFENMPEGIRYGVNGDRAQERIDLLSDWRDQLSDMMEEEV